MRTIALAGTTLALVATCTLTSTPAQGAGRVTFTFPSCGKVTMRNGLSRTVDIITSNGHQFNARPGGTDTTFSTNPTGPTTWVASDPDNGFRFLAKGTFTSPSCSSAPRRQAEGDQTGDGRADLLAVANTGNLLFYRSTGPRLAAATVTGSGFGSTIFLRHLAAGSAGPSNILVSVRTDGGLYYHRRSGAAGRYLAGTRVASVKGYDRFTVLDTDNTYYPGDNVLLGMKGTSVYAWLLRSRVQSTPTLVDAGWLGVTRLTAVQDMTGDHFADLLVTTRDGAMWRRSIVDDPWQTWDRRITGFRMFTPAVRVGSGWHRMGLVASPGSMDGDTWADVVGRTPGGQMRRYPTYRGAFSTPTTIGPNWTSIRLVG